VECLRSLAVGRSLVVVGLDVGTQAGVRPQAVVRRGQRLERREEFGQRSVGVEVLDARLQSVCGLGPLVAAVEDVRRVESVLSGDVVA
jgi:hypothetical protein